MWLGSRVNCQEATSSCVGIRHHLEEHLVSRGDQCTGPERATEAPQALAANMAAVHIDVVVATQVVAFQVDRAKGEDHDFALRDLWRHTAHTVRHI